ncbi:hypothetical protein C8J55DRAFT_555355 [Lentinula edodes]|uniref:Uncharacterized protein n=1 Tax=Lentinula lateritia TaxID=40482 RepID=A0A9W9AZ73_9AGAR|nr:hypothetical protein C8J55DRAFT_555355 [Lentinula edodes]
MSTSPITNLNRPAMQNSGGAVYTCSEADSSKSSQPCPPDRQTSRNDPQARDNSSSEPKDNLSTDHGERIKSKRHHGHQNNTSKDSIVRFCVNRNCNNPIPLDQSHQKCQACRRTYRERRKSHSSTLCGQCGTTILPPGSRYKTCSPCLVLHRERRRQRLALASKGVENEVDSVANGANDVENDADIPVATEMHETESNHDSDNNEEIPHQVSESHNLNARVKTTLMLVEQDNQQRADSINEPLNDVDSSIKYFVDANSSVDQSEKNEKTYVKQEDERLHRELKGEPITSLGFFIDATNPTELKSQMSAWIRRDIAEHAHLNVLNRLLIQTRSEYLQNKLSRSAMTETFDNLSSQLRELADRRLENMPVGFGSILDLIKTSEIVNDNSPSKKQSHS